MITIELPKGSSREEQIRYLEDMEQVLKVMLAALRKEAKLARGHG